MPSSKVNLTIISYITLFCYGCYHPPYNNFQNYNRTYLNSAKGAAIGTAAGATAGAPVLIGTAIGALVGAGIGIYKESNYHLIRDLIMHQVEFIEYGDTLNVILPVDRYFMFNSPRFRPSCFPTLEIIAKLINTYPKCPIYVAGFTNAIGSRYHKNKLSQARAEAVVTFLWSHQISASRLSAEGYGDKYAIGDNNLVHGSAYNRRIEIQWFKHCRPPIITPVLMGYIK